MEEQTVDAPVEEVTGAEEETPSAPEQSEVNTTTEEVPVGVKTEGEAAPAETEEEIQARNEA